MVSERHRNPVHQPQQFDRELGFRCLLRHHRSSSGIRHPLPALVIIRRLTRHATKEGGFSNEGRLWQKGQIYQVPYRAITPKRAECDNLLVPVCVSSTHVAFCSIRVEASWMMLGEAAGIAATMATNGNLPIQSISVPLLQQKLLSSEIPIKLPNADSMDNEKRRENNE